MCGFRCDRRAVEGLPTRELQCGKTQSDALNESAFATSYVGPTDSFQRPIGVQLTSRTENIEMTNLEHEKWKRWPLPDALIIYHLGLCRRRPAVATPEATTYKTVHQTVYRNGHPTWLHTSQLGDLTP